MKRKEFIIVIIVLLVAFASVSIFKNHKKATGQAGVSAGVKSDSIQRFWSYYNVATSYRLHDKVDSAIANYRDAIDLNPTHEDALYYLGIVYMKAGNFEKARETWQKLAELNPKSERAYNQLGNLYFCSSRSTFFDPAKAKGYFDRAYQLNKESVNPQVRLGEIDLFQNKTTEAAATFDKLLIMDHKSLEISFLYGYLQWKKGFASKANRSLESTFGVLKSAAPKNGSIDENQDCNLFLSWINTNLALAEKGSAKTLTNNLYPQFDEYLTKARSRLVAQ